MGYGALSGISDQGARGAGAFSRPRPRTERRSQPQGESEFLTPVQQRMHRDGFNLQRNPITTNCGGGENVAKQYSSWSRAGVDRVALEIGEAPSDV